MPWLLDPSLPSLHWRVLTDLIHRPGDSPAVVRARGGADAVDPVASLIEELLPDGSWVCDTALWNEFAGPGWRILAAVQWGADPTDPRLHAASLRLVEDAPGSGGFSARDGENASPWLTARLLQGLARLGWCRHARFQEALAWLDEAAPRAPNGGWLRVDGGGATGPCRVTAVALLDALTVCGGSNRAALRARAESAVSATIAEAGEAFYLLGHPNIDRTDAAEALSVFARAKTGLDPGVVEALSRLQQVQDDGGRWARKIEVPESLPIGRPPRVGEASKWITLAAASAVLHYAVEAGLPRRFPQKPS